MKIKSLLSINKTQKILKIKNETSIFPSSNSKITMKWKKKDYKREFLKKGKNTSPMKKILYNKLKKK